MISIEEFNDGLKRLQPPIDPMPLGALITDIANTSQFVVAGPGTGKTTALAVRTVKLILVDGVDPAGIVATTFTRRAAKELRSRILKIADDLRRSLENSSVGGQRVALSRIDFNRIYTGTLDSLSEDIMTEFRGPEIPPPVTIDENVADDLMLREGLFHEGRFRESKLSKYYKRINRTTYGVSAKGLAAFAREIHQRSLYDGVDLRAYGKSARRRASILVDAIMDYRRYLDLRGWYDFALLENLFFERLSTGKLADFTRDARVLLVDEYQDTNFLQERIFFELGAHCISHNGGLTVVGDDDQALYRFRGTTPELFINFPVRIRSALGVNPSLVYLTENRRSTDPIVDFVNDFVQLDASYQTIRVKGKPQLMRARQRSTSFPILGMFRRNLDLLTADLTDLISRIVNGAGFRIPRTDVWIRRDITSGSAADIVLLASSPREETVNGGPLLPLLLRRRLQTLRHPINVYNPRGQAIGVISQVEQLLGLSLECIDPSGKELSSMKKIPGMALVSFGRWRRAAVRLIKSRPRPVGPPSLRDFVRAWSNRKPTSRHAWIETETPLLDLLYKLMTWIPFFREDLEGLAYLETISRTATSAGSLGRYEANISFRGSRDLQASIRELYWNFFVPLALNMVEVDEELLDTLPNDRLGVFSIHQSKGLEFPLVIVDVGSNFRRRHPMHAFKRFPREPGPTSRLEDDLRPFSKLGSLSRDGTDRAFDDLTRQYFVAFSRAQDVLLLVGLTSMIQSGGIPHVAMGWTRDGNWPWLDLSRIHLI